MGGDRAVVDDAPALRVLAAHDAKGHAGAEEHPRQVHLDRAAPVLDRDLVDGSGRREDAGIVEETVDPPRPFGEIMEGHLHRICIRHVEWQGHGPVAVGVGQFVQRIGAARHEAHIPAVCQHALGDGAPDTGARARDDGGFHSLSSCASSSSGAAGTFRSSIPSGA